MTGLLRLMGRLCDWLMGGRPVDMADRLAPYADPFHLDTRAGAAAAAASPVGRGPGAGPPARPGVCPPGVRPSTSP